MTEEEYSNELQSVSTEIDHAFESHHVFEEINRLGKDDRRIYAILNRNALFWNTQVICLQTSLFIGMARIFDSTSDAHSIHRLVNLTLAHPEFFSKDSLYSRRLRAANDVKPDWLDDLVQGAWIPQNSSELRYIKKALKPYTQIYNDVYRPIRNNVYGHRLGRVEETIKLFERTNRTEIGSILDFLRELIFIIFQLFHNGNKREFGSASFGTDKDEIRKEVQNVLLALASSTLAR